MDEVEYAIKGYVYRMRKQRMFAYQTVLSNGLIKNPPTAEAMFPLMFDDELNGKMSASEIEDTYKQWEGKL